MRITYTDLFVYLTTLQAKLFSSGHLTICWHILSNIKLSPLQAVVSKTENICVTTALGGQRTESVLSVLSFLLQNFLFTLKKNTSSCLPTSSQT